MAVHRRAGLALLFYAVGTCAALVLSGTPGGDYDEATLRAYVDSGHLTSIGGALLGMLAVLALLPALRGVGGDRGAHDPVWGLGVAAVAVGIVGWFVSAAMPVAFLEAGDAVTAAVPLAVVQIVGEIGVLVSVCGPAFLVGAAALTLVVRNELPVWVRVLAVVGGICGITAALFFTLFLYLLWATVMGIWLMARRAPARVEADRAMAAAR